MIALEVANDVSIVRIHDDYVEHQPEMRLAAVSHVVTDAYKRRFLTTETDGMNDITATVEAG